MGDEASNFDETPAGERPEAEVASIENEMPDDSPVELDDEPARTSSNGDAETAEMGSAEEDNEEVSEPENNAEPGSAAGEVPAEAPPVAEQMQWFVLKVQSNREKSIRNSLLRAIKREGLEEYFGEVIIPTEKVVEKSKGGKKRVTERKLYPGYIMIHMVLNDETWYLVRDTGGVGDFTGAAGKPIAMQEEEIKRMLGLESTKEAEPAKIKIDLAPGETVKIKEGSFESFEGAIDTIDEEHGKITVLVEIFGRSVPTELEYWQVEKI